MDDDEFYNRILCDLAFSMYLPIVFEAFSLLGVWVQLAGSFTDIS